MSATHGRGGGTRGSIRLLTVVVAALLSIVGACSSDDDDDADPVEDETTEDTAVGAPSGSIPPRFCDVYLDYLAESTPENLAAVVAATDDDQVAAYAEVIGSDAGITEVLAATLDLDELARLDCQPEWTGGVQGAGSTEAAAQAFYDAVVAGDRVGAANVASANAIAVFEPWQPVPAAGETPALVEVGELTFTIVLDDASLAHCQVEVGVVVSCQVEG